MKNEELGESMIRDPRDKALSVPGGSESELVKLLQDILGPERCTEKVLLAAPVSMPKNVIDAKADRACAACGEQVWLAPSSYRTMDAEDAIVCMGCVLKRVSREEFRRLILEDMKRAGMNFDRETEGM